MNATTMDEAAAADTARRNKLVINLILVSSFVVILNETMMSNATPPLMQSLGVTAAAAQWVTTAFLLTMAVGIPMTGFLLQRLTTRVVYVLAMSLFSIGTLAALRHRDRTGEGQVVDCCLLDSAITMVEIPTSYYLATGQEGGEGGRPPYKAKDGYVVISASSKDMASRLIRIATGDENASVAGWTSRAGLEDPRKLAVSKWCAENTVEHIVSTLLKAEIPVAPVNTIPQVAKDPHLWEREMLVKMPDALAGEIHVPGATIKMSKTPGRVGHVPTPGEHTDEVLSSLLGYDQPTLRELREAKVIG